MKVRIIVGSKITDRNVLNIVNEYLKRLRGSIDTEVLSFKGIDNGKDYKKFMELSDGFYRVGLAIEGKMYNSIDFSEKIHNLGVNKLAFLIGGAEGLTNGLKKDCDELFSLSKLTFPHEIALMVLVEQLYRASTIVKGHPYHK